MMLPTKARTWRLEMAGCQVRRQKTMHLYPVPTYTRKRIDWIGVALLAGISAIPSFFEIKEAGGVCALSEKNRIVGF
jgi:hypothetical protein